MEAWNKSSFVTQNNTIECQLTDATMIEKNVHFATSTSPAW